MQGQSEALLSYLNWEMRKINWFSALFLFLLIEASFINSFIIITKPFYGWETGLLKSLCLKSGALQKCEKGENLKMGNSSIGR